MIDKLEKYIKSIKSENLFRQCRISENIINLDNNDYMNLRFDPEVIQSGINAMYKYGTTSSGSPVVNGYCQIHEELEEKLSLWYDGGEVLLWGSGYSLNYNLLKHLPGEEDTIIADRYMHHSALRGALESGAQLKRFKHNDIEDLERLLKASKGIRFVVMESIYSMDGDSIDLQEVAKLKLKYPFIWILDEAHAVGWYGPGLCVEQGVRNSVDIIVGTLGKALASAGGFAVFNNKLYKDYLINMSKEFMYTTYLSPCSAGCALGALNKIKNKLINDKPVWLSESLKIKKLFDGLFLNKIENDSAILPCVLGSSEKVMFVGNQLRDNGISVGVIRYPSVPMGKERLRISLNRVHTEWYFNELIIPKIKKVL